MVCYVCGEKFNLKIKNFIKVNGDTERYRDAAHLICNLQCKIDKYIPYYLTTRLVIIVP